MEALIDNMQKLARWGWVVRSMCTEFANESSHQKGCFVNSCDMIELSTLYES